MRNITEIYSPKNNFWNEVPQFLIIEPFLTFHKNDKSRSKTVSSNVMWAISLVNHPKSDIYYVSDKLSQVGATMLGDKDFNWAKYDHITEAFIEAALTQAEKSQLSWEDRMRSRDDFLKGKVYSFDYYGEDGSLVKGIAEDLDKMASRTAKLYTEYFSIKKLLEEEKNKSSRKGSKMESLTDGGSI